MKAGDFGMFFDISKIASQIDSWKFESQKKGIL